MKKYLKIFFLTLIFFSTFTVCVHAGSLTNSIAPVETANTTTASGVVSQLSMEAPLQQVKFEVTSGLDLLKEFESTFDDTRTISGSSESGSTITIIVYTRISEEELEEVAQYALEVGATGLFSQTINLENGENIIVIKAEKVSKSDSVVTAVVKRRSKNIKSALEQRIVMPGDIKKLILK